MEFNVTLTNREHNVLMVALDHMYEHLDDLVGELDTFEEENANLKRIYAVNSLQKQFKQ
jgi:DhnA family fructose-bisphosphate aldolase class Ia